MCVCVGGYLCFKHFPKSESEEIFKYLCIWFIEQFKGTVFLLSLLSNVFCQISLPGSSRTSWGYAEAVSFGPSTTQLEIFPLPTTCGLATGKTSSGEEGQSDSGYFSLCSTSKLCSSDLGSCKADIFWGQTSCWWGGSLGLAESHWFHSPFRYKRNPHSWIRRKWRGEFSLEAWKPLSHPQSLHPGMRTQCVQSVSRWSGLLH